MSQAIMIGKLDAARRELETAIRLWFNDGDPVAIHVLAYSAYEIIHTVSKMRDPNRRDLLFDSLVIKDEQRADYNRFIKSHANFFKHGDRDGEAVIEFRPVLTEMFLLFSILGLELCGERKSAAEAAYVWWLQIHHPDWLTDSGNEMIAKHFKPEDLPDLRRLGKSQFFNNFITARKIRGG